MDTQRQLRLRPLDVIRAELEAFTGLTGGRARRHIASLTIGRD